jgi:hypothetical protein
MQPKTLKLVIKGEIPELPLVYTTLEGEIITIKNSRKSPVPSKKNDKRVGVNPKTLKQFVIPSKQHEKWLAENKPIFQNFVEHVVRVHKIPLPIQRLKAKILFYFPDSKTRDLFAKVETLADIMHDKDVKLIQDDDFKLFRNISAYGWTDRSSPRTEIYLTVLLPGHPDYEYDKTPPEYFTQLRLRKNAQRRISRDLKRRSIIDQQD